MSSWAVVTGASGGLGEAYARELAGQGSDVVLLARSAEKMERLASELSAEHGVETLVIPCDLSDATQRAALVARLDGLDVHTLVNNAGFGTFGMLGELERARISQEVGLNVVALTELTHAVIPQMITRGRGAIINVASTAAFQPIPQMATYAATKSYVLSFSSALWAELSGTGVRVVCICPGPTDTSFFDNAGNGDAMVQRRSPQQVVASTFAALRAGKPYVVDGAGNKLAAQATRFIPTSLLVQAASWVATR
ncbi:SDR family NAD(P)-dependent oxidoreductase [Tessaracoccus antarcticus]|uniref:SDR family oxidoreductase n=1 Tax=Tessaracoccus antarcticus TaxID=2479848 RepID=A0A3M0GUY8_9ACTN|nr:SDR family oxidoreductase [Tessaracoccus antarcticus]RMB61136.1 SDR family oxidoreductase [Tessaracoccus antarcticus]